MLRYVLRLLLTTESKGWPVGRAEPSRRRADGDGEEQREHQRVQEHPGDSSACPEAVLGCLATCEQADATIQPAGGGPRAAAAGCLGLGGAAHDSEVVAHVVGREGARGGGDAATASSVSPTMADVAGRGVTEGERERASEGER